MVKFLESTNEHFCEISVTKIVVINTAYIHVPEKTSGVTIFWQKLGQTMKNDEILCIFLTSYQKPHF